MRDRSGNSRDAAAATAPAACPSPLRQPRRHYAAPASSDDAHAAPAHERFAGAVASDDPTWRAPWRVKTSDRATRPAPARSPRAMSAMAPTGPPRALGQWLTRWFAFPQEAPSTPMPRAAAASS